MALEYLFARRSGGGGGTTKDIAHIWDLGTQPHKQRHWGRRGCVYGPAWTVASDVRWVSLWCGQAGAAS